MAHWNGGVHAVFGAGPVGSALALELAERGRRVRVITRSGTHPHPGDERIEAVAADAAVPDRAAEAVSGASVIYNCANAPYTQWPEVLPLLFRGILRAAESAGAVLVLADNLYCYGPADGPLVEGLPCGATGRKGRVRALLAEEYIQAHVAGRVQVAIGRASDFFGPGVLQSHAGERSLGRIACGRTAETIGDPDLPHTYTYVRDFAAALTVLGEHSEALGRAWHVPSVPAVTTRQFLQAAADICGQKLRLRTLRARMVGALALFVPIMRELKETMYQFEAPFVVDSRDFETTFNVRPTPLEDSLKTTMDWFASRSST